MHVSFWALNPDGTYDVPLPDVATWTLSPVDGSPGAVDLAYPVAGRNFEVLRSQVTQDRDLELAVWVTGGDIGSLRAYLNTSDLDDVTESGVATFAGNFLPVRMEEACVAPRTEVVQPPTGPSPTEDLAAFRVYSATAGRIMATLMQEAQGRGALDDIVWTFNNTVDSLGIPWSKTITLKIAPGTTHLKVLESLVGASMCEWDVIWNGDQRELVMWEQGTRGVDHTEKADPLILWAGKTLTEAPRKHSVRDAGTALLLAGGEGLYQEFSDPTALARRGRRIERFNSQGSYTDPGSLAAFGQAKLPQVTAGVMEVGHGIAVTPDGPRPLVDYTVGDHVFSDTGRGLERLRIAQLTVSGDQDGILTAGLSLNDLLADQLESLSRRIDGIEGGSTVTGTSNASPVDPDAVDTMPPASPQGVAVGSLAYQDQAGNTFSSFQVAWGEVITNEDQTAIDDLAGYRVRWRYVTLEPQAYRELSPTTDTTLSFGGVLPGELVGVQVAAFDNSGNQSPWSVPEVQLVGQDDTTPPPVPSTPVVSTYLGQLKVVWNGLGSAGEAMPPDFGQVEVHASSTSNFTPSAVTLADRMVGSRETVLTGRPYGATVFVRLVAVDRTGNASTPSVQGSGTPAEIGFADLAYDNNGNLVEDGSFELAGSRATHAARSHAAWTFVQGGADHGEWFARGTGTVGTGSRPLILSPPIPVVPGDELAMRFALRRTSANGGLSARIRWLNAAGATIIENLLTYGVAEPNNAWANKEVSPYIAPAGAASFQVLFTLDATCTAGSWDVDRVEVREMLGTLLIRNAAITNAKIANLDVGKLTSGDLTAIVALLGTIRTAAPPNARVEIDSGGVRKYDAANVLRVEITETSTYIDGRIVTGLPGESRISMGANSFGRDNLIAYDFVGTTVGIGQIYNEGTGQPSNHGVLVQRSDNGQDIFDAYGSGNNVGVSVRNPDTGVTVLSTRRGQSDSIQASALNGSRVFAGQLSTGDAGLIIANPSNATILSASASELFFKTQNSPSGAAGILSITDDNFVSLRLEAGSARGGFEYSGVTGFANARCDVALQVVDLSVSGYREVRASNVTFSSGVDSKEEFVALPEPALSVLRGAPAARWRYRGDRDGDPLHVGPVAEDLPEWAVQPPDAVAPTDTRLVEQPPAVDDDGREVPTPPRAEQVPSSLPNTERVSAMTMIGLLWDAVRELDAEMDEFRVERGRVAPARRRVDDLLADVRAGRVRRRPGGPRRPA